MLVFILGLAVTIVSSFGLVMQQDHHIHQTQYQNLKFYSEEASAAAAQYLDLEEFSEGNFVFNQEEGRKAGESIIRENLNLNEDLEPEEGSYFEDTFEVEFLFYDDTNLDEEAIIYSSGKFHVVITEPTVVVRINAGDSRHRLIEPIKIMQVSAHSWEGEQIPSSFWDN